MKTTGQLIRQLRQEKRGWTLEELGVHAGSTKDYVWQIETGRRTPGAAMLRRLALALGVHTRELVGDE